MGDRPTVYLLRPRKEIERNLLLIGNHDLALNWVINHLRAESAGFDLQVQPVGGLAGLVSLRRNECHLAGVDWLDDETAQGHSPFVKQALTGGEMAQVNLVCRMQGLVVKRGNPKAITELTGLIREDVTFINQQCGTGTRVFLEAWLKQNGYTPEQIRGFEREEYTHLGAVAAVAGGTADTALGIWAAARAIELDFLPLAEERYDLILPIALLDDERIRHLIGILRSPAFRAAAEALGGYRTTDSGQVLRRRGDMNHG